MNHAEATDRPGKKHHSLQHFGDQRRDPNSQQAEVPDQKQRRTEKHRRLRQLTACQLS